MTERVIALVEVIRAPATRLYQFMTQFELIGVENMRRCDLELLQSLCLFLLEFGPDEEVARTLRLVQIEIERREVRSRMPW